MDRSISDAANQRLRAGFTEESLDGSDQRVFGQPQPSQSMGIVDVGAGAGAGAETGGGLSGGEWAAIGTAAAAVFGAILQQRQAEKTRKDRKKEFGEEVRQKEKDREQTILSRQENAIGNIGQNALKGGELQGSALSRLAAIFGGLQ